MPDYYELRRYQLRNGPQARRLDDFLRDLAIPALNLYGVQPVGVFSVLVGDPIPSVYALLRHPSLESVAAVRNRLSADDEFQKAAAFFHEAPAADPSFVQMESSFLVSFAGIPELEVPPEAKESRPRIFELRRYESHGEGALKRKIEMFNGAEIAIFRRTGLRPVFFGETLIGARQPNLTYMLVFESMAAREQSWIAFREDPEWRQLWSTPGLTDAEIVSNVTSVILRPAPYSQI
ncbi:MAG TPA: NIPSNAP family protein [Candidatus Methylomirabilis sp.]